MREQKAERMDCRTWFGLDLKIKTGNTYTKLQRIQGDVLNKNYMPAESSDALPLHQKQRFRAWFCMIKAKCKEQQAKKCRRGDANTHGQMNNWRRDVKTGKNPQKVNSVHAKQRRKRAWCT